MLMQPDADADATRILAEVLRQARTLWPLNESDAEKTVLVRIDILKVRFLHHFASCNLWTCRLAATCPPIPILLLEWIQTRMFIEAGSRVLVVKETKSSVDIQEHLLGMCPNLQL